MVQDAVRVHLPRKHQGRVLPTADKEQFQTVCPLQHHHRVHTKLHHGAPQLRLAEFLFMPKEYPDLRSFYNKMETKDQESVVLTASPVAAAAKPAGSAN